MLLLNYIHIPFLHLYSGVQINQIFAAAVSERHIYSSVIKVIVGNEAVALWTLGHRLCVVLNILRSMERVDVLVTVVTNCDWSQYCTIY